MASCLSDEFYCNNTLRFILRSIRVDVTFEANERCLMNGRAGRVNRSVNNLQLHSHQMKNFCHFLKQKEKISSGSSSFSLTSEKMKQKSLSCLLFSLLVSGILQPEIRTQMDEI